MDIFSAVIFNGKSVVPNSINTFATLDKAKAFIVGTFKRDIVGHSTRWEEWEEGKFLFGYGDKYIKEPIAAVFGSELE